MRRDQSRHINQCLTWHDVSRGGEISISMPTSEVRLKAKPSFFAHFCVKQMADGPST